MARQNGGIANNLANKIFRLQKQSGGGVPGNVVRSARLVKQGAFTSNDVEIMRRYLGISRSGASALGRQAAGIDRTIASSQQFSNNLDMIQRGNIQGYIGIAQQTSQFLRDLARSKDFQRVVEGVAEKIFSDPGAGSRIVQGARRGTRALVAGLAVAGIAGEAVTWGGQLGEMIAGNTKTGQTRLLESEQRLIAADKNASQLQKSIASKKALASAIRDQERGNIIQLGTNYRLRQYGLDSASIAKLEAKSAMQSAGLGRFADRLYTRARSEALREQGIGGETIGGFLNDTLGANDEALQVATSQKIEARVARYMDLIAKANAEAGKRSFGRATTTFNEAAKELGVPPSVWQDPTTLYKQQVGSRAAERLWARSQMSKAGPRTGD